MLNLAVVELKHCPRCDLDLPMTDYGICKARRDGLNLYCKICVRLKMAISRQRIREYNAVRIKSKVPAPVAVPVNMSPRRMARISRKPKPADRVLEAIRCGAVTQAAIARVTRLRRDEVCDALASLLLWTRSIRTDVLNHTRRYFINEFASDPGQMRLRRAPENHVSESYGISTIYFTG